MTLVSVGILSNPNIGYWVSEISPSKTALTSHEKAISRALGVVKH